MKGRLSLHRLEIPRTKRQRLLTESIAVYLQLHRAPGARNLGPHALPARPTRVAQLLLRVTVKPPCRILLAQRTALKSVYRKYFLAHCFCLKATEAATLKQSHAAVSACGNAGPREPSRKLCGPANTLSASLGGCTGLLGSQGALPGSAEKLRERL